MARQKNKNTQKRQRQQQQQQQNDSQEGGQPSQPQKRPWDEDESCDDKKRVRVGSPPDQGIQEQTAASTLEKKQVKEAEGGDTNCSATEEEQGPLFENHDAASDSELSDTPVCSDEDVDTPVCSDEDVDTPVFSDEDVDTPVFSDEDVDTPVFSDEDVALPVHEGEEPTEQWQHQPPLPWLLHGVVGLRNLGATCYMNAILQQLFSLEQLRHQILSAPTAIIPELENGESPEGLHEVGLIKQLQAVFRGLLDSRCSAIMPWQLWNQCRILGMSVSHEEQQDSADFFLSLAESIDIGLTMLGQPQFVDQCFGGTLVDIKTCLECSRRGTREESFKVLRVPVMQNTLQEAMRDFVSRETLEGENCVNCDTCQKKVRTEKRQVLGRLPNILAIHLKRFSYDMLRGTIKDNKYFEFPRVLNMAPFTTHGEEVIQEQTTPPEVPTESSQYRLRGVVVHLGTGEGGHYYSFVHHRGPDDDTEKWYLFDDHLVEEAHFDNDDFLRATCFGGQLFNQWHNRWMTAIWSAYMLLYEKVHSIAVDKEKPVSDSNSHHSSPGTSKEESEETAQQHADCSKSEGQT